MKDLWIIEREYRAQGIKAICGTDEAGRGPLAGPVYAGAVILPDDIIIDGLDDSKKLTPKKRDLLFDVIKENAICWGIGSATAEEIDSINILNAAQLAMHRAIEAMGVSPELVLVDGNVARGFSQPTVTIVGGDGKSANIAAASILAKVSRDRYMDELDKIYPMYGFLKHKGYPTKAHVDALNKFGPCPEHRRSFKVKGMD